MSQASLSPSRNRQDRPGPVQRPCRATLPAYLHLRGATYYFKRKIPADSAGAFPNYKGQVWKCLGTGLLERAKVMLAVEVTEFNLTLAQYRQQKVRALHQPERLTHQATVTPALPDPAVPNPELAPAEAARLALMRSLEQGLAQLREMTGTAAIQTLVSSPAAQPRSAVAETSAAPDQGRSVATPNQGKGSLALLHLFEHWRLGQSNARSIGAVEKVVMDFRQLHGPLPLEAITRQHVRDYRDQLIEQRLASGTIKNRIGFLSTLFRFGQVELIEHLHANPFEKINVVAVEPLREPKDRRAFEVAELNTMFSSRLYTEGYRPEGQALEAAYWLPLLGPFVGARIEELCQLRIGDIQCINGHWCIRISDIGEDQELKTKSSERRVPLHADVIKAGFLAYVAGVAKQAKAKKGSDAFESQLFPSLSNDNANGTHSNAAGKWFARYMESIGLDDPSLDYHSFRYTFKQACSLCGIDNEVRDALCGHWVGNRDAGRTYMKGKNRQYPYPLLVAAIDKLTYAELRISHLFVKDPQEGVQEYLTR